MWDDLLRPLPDLIATALLGRIGAFIVVFVVVCLVITVIVWSAFFA